MPASWVKDEDIWEKAKKEVDKDKYDEDSYWAVVTEVYKNMGGKKKKSSAEVLDRIAYQLHNEGYKRLAFRVCEVRDKLALQWTDEQEKKFQQWRERYEGKFSPEKIQEVRQLWEDQGMGRAPLPGEPDYVDTRPVEPEPEPEPPPAAPEVDPEEEALRRRLITDTSEGMKWHHTPEEGGHSEEYRRKWIEEHGGPPIWKMPRFIPVKEEIVESKRADLDPSGGDLPDSDDPVVLELMGYDTYQGSDPMEGPGIAIKIEGEQFQIYVIEDPEQEFFGEAYFSRTDQKEWAIEHISERLEPGSQSIIPPQWHEGTVISDEELKDWLASEAARF